MLKSHGIKVSIISGKSNKALDFRIKQLGIAHVIIRCSDKLCVLNTLITKTKCKLDQTAFVGDYIIDIAIMKKVALSIAPADAHPLAIDAACYVCLAKGGEGAARESAEYILKNAGISL